MALFHQSRVHQIPPSATCSGGDPLERSALASVPLWTVAPAQRARVGTPLSHRILVGCYYSRRSLTFAESLGHPSLASATLPLASTPSFASLPPLNVSDTLSCSPARA
jgi:hypothetical protein